MFKTPSFWIMVIAIGANLLANHAFTIMSLYLAIFSTAMIIALRWVARFEVNAKNSLKNLHRHMHYKDNEQ